MAALLPPDAGLRVSLEVVIPSDVAYIERVVDLVRHPCAELAYNAHQLALNVPVALSEAISNAILRANNEDPIKRVLVRAEIDTRQLVVDVMDEGEPFDLDSVSHDAADTESYEINENAIHLVSSRLVMRYSVNGDSMTMSINDNDGRSRLSLRRIS